MNATLSLMVVNRNCLAVIGTWHSGRTDAQGTEGGVKRGGREGMVLGFPHLTDPHRR